MSLEAAMRATEVLLALAFLQQSVEHLAGPKGDRWIFLPRIALCLVLLTGVADGLALGGLVVISAIMLHRYQGPYNGGSDRMGVLILCGIALAQVMPSIVWQERVFGYLAVQLTLSYFISGKVKLTNPDWRSGQALQDVFAFSAYPVSAHLRRLSEAPRLLWVASWAVILFETLFPLTLFSQPTLIAALLIGAVFHLGNAYLFGLNRFFWTWIAAYPSILWLQARLLE